MLKDGYGREVPGFASAGFAPRQGLANTAQRLTQALSELRAVADQHPHLGLRVPEAEELITSAVRLVREGTPHCVCFCHSDEDCPWCHNRRWVTWGEYRRNWRAMRQRELWDALSKADMQRIVLARAKKLHAERLKPDKLPCPSSPAGKTPGNLRYLDPKRLLRPAVVS